MLTKAVRELLEMTGRISTRGIADVDGLVGELKAAGFDASVDESNEWIIIPESQLRKKCNGSHW